MRLFFLGAALPWASVARESKQVARDTTAMKTSPSSRMPCRVVARAELVKPHDRTEAAVFGEMLLRCCLWIPLLRGPPLQAGQGMG